MFFSFFLSLLISPALFPIDSSFCFSLCCDNYISLCCVALQVLRYFDYVFTGVFTFEMLIKVTKYHCVGVCLSPDCFFNTVVLV